MTTPARSRFANSSAPGVAALAGVAWLAGAVFAAPPGTPRPTPSPSASPANGSSGPAAGGGAPQKAAARANITPHVWPRTLYKVEGRLGTQIKNVTFKAPAAYEQSFSFWTSRMKGSARTEMFELLTTTREAEPDGAMPFRRQVTRYQVEIQEMGATKVPTDNSVSQVLSLVWEGVVDPVGAVRSMNRTAGPADAEELDERSFKQIDRLFPRFPSEHPMKVGDSFVETVALPLPQRLTVKGLEAVGFVMTRRLSLKEVQGDAAIFDMTLDYAVDPATPPTAPRTTCVIGGGGKGDATFNVTDGAFASARWTSRLEIDIEAPLKRLPDQAADADPGTAATHIDMSLDLSGKLTVSRLFDASAEPAAPPSGS